MKSLSRRASVKFRAGVMGGLMIASLGVLEAAPPGAKEPFDPNSGVRKAGLGTPTPLDKMIALDTVLGKNGVDWAGVCNRFHVDVDPDNY
ncbi:MAG: hypothetical protein ACQKBY_04120, partial [Verrucomicrobiales bacterium]